MRRTAHHVGVGALLTGLVAAVWWAGPGPSGLLPALRHPQAYVDRVGADAAAVALTCLACWIVLAWLAAGLVLTAASALPGGWGRLAEAAAIRVLPAAIHRTAAVALGISLITGGTASAVTPAHVSTGAGAAHRAPDVAALTVDWPAAPPGLDWPTGRPAPAAPSTAGHSTAGPSTTVPSTAGPSTHGVEPAPRPAPVRSTVTVRPGDTLWHIAARALGPGATNARIARAWPRWYAANRHLIGPDPNLIHPGQRLLRPPGT